MKTSKKILSFFLAVVMVVSSCSVGLTAFAKDDSDSNRTYWNNASNANDAFDALNNLVDAYLPKLLSNPAIKDQLEKALGITVTEETSLSDLVAGVSPLLVNTLSGANEADVLDGNRYNALVDYRYNYLKTPNQTMGFFELYNFCRVMSNIQEDDANANPTFRALKDYAIATRIELDKLKPYFDQEASNVNDLLSSDPFNAQLINIQGWAGELGEAVFYTPEDMGKAQITVNGVSIPLSQLKESEYDVFAKVVNNNFYDNKVPLQKPEDVFYYGLTMLMLRSSGLEGPRPQLDTMLNSLNHITNAGFKVSAERAGDATKSFDKNDYMTVLKGILTFNDYIASPEFANLYGKNLTEEQFNGLAETEKAKIRGYYELRIYDLLALCLYDKLDLNEYTAENSVIPDYYSSNFPKVAIGLVKAIDPSVTYADNIKPLEFTDNMILAAAKEIGAKPSWNNSITYINSYLKEKNVLSKPVNTAISILSNNDKIALGLALRDLGTAPEAEKAAKLAAVKALMPTDAVPVVSNMTIVDRINFLVPNTYATEKFSSVTGSYIDDVNETFNGYLSITTLSSEFCIADAANRNIFANNSEYKYENYKIAKVKDSTGNVVKEVTLENYMMVDAVNLLLNDKIESLFGTSSSIPINDIVNALLSTPVDLKLTLTNIWKELYNNPVETIFNLAPLLTILIDELLVPIIFTENDTQTANGFNQLLVGMLFNKNVSGIGAPLYKFSLASGNTDVGLATQTNTSGQMMFSFDLNKMLPGILNYILGETTSPEVVSLGTYGEIKNEAGKVIVAEADKNVPRFTNILAADREIAKVTIGDTLVNLINDHQFNDRLNVLKNEAVEAKKAEIKANNPNISDKDLAEQSKLTNAEIEAQKAKITDAEKADFLKKATGLNEIITRVGTTLNGAVKKFFTDNNGINAKRERHMLDDTTLVVSQRGLNNLFVAVPQLVDYLGKGILEKYAISGSDWTATYDGKLVDVTVSNKNGSQSAVDLRNSTNEEFKKLSAEKNGSKVLEQVLNIAIGNWLNGLIDYVNDIVSDTSSTNKIVNELPLVFGLLDAIGGLGPKSVVSDLVDGLFQLKRTDENSFAITEQPDTHYKGFSNKAGLFLICNLQFEKDGEQRGIIPLVMKLVGNGATTTSEASTGAATTATSNASPAVSTFSNSANPKIQSRAASNYSELLSSQNKADARNLISKLDTILSTLLSDITVNGKNITEISSFATEIINMLAPAIGEQNANDLVNNVIVAYVNIVANKTYDDATLSTFVVNTYATLENIVSYMFYDGPNAILAKDTDRLVADALTGIISPDSVSVRLTGGDTGDYKDTFKELQKKDYLRWNDFKADLAGGTKNILKFNVNNDENAFFEAMAESFGGVTAIFGAVLRRAVTIDSTPDNVKNLYSEVYYPLISGIFNGIMAPEEVMTPAEYNNVNTTDSSRLVGSFIKPINSLLEKLLAGNSKPATELLKLVAGLGNILNDGTIVANPDGSTTETGLVQIVDGLVGVIRDELDGFTNIVSNLSPTFQTELKNLIDTQELTIGNSKYTIKGLLDMITSVAKDENGNVKQDILVNLLNSMLSLTVGIKLPAIDWARLAASQSEPETTLLLIFNYIVTTVTSDPVLQLLLQAKYPGIKDLLKSLTASQIINIINQILDEVQDPTQVYWSFTKYANEALGRFVYPDGIFPSDATNAVKQLDQIVENIFPLLKELGVLNADSLAALLNTEVYTNATLTNLAKGLYTALNGKIDNSSMTIGDITKAFGIDPSPAGLAKYLTDSSYGNTYSAAAQTLNSVNSWNDVKSLNWGFTDGTDKAKAGFVNGLAAVLRPFNNIFAMLLVGTNNTGALTVDTEGLVATVSAINTKLSDTVTLANGVITIAVNGSTNVEINLANTVREIANIINEGKIHISSNGYQSAIVPLLEALTIDGFQSYSSYLNGYRAAKDTLFTGILNPVLGFVDKLAAAPFDTLTDVLPNVALFIDGYGVSQFLNNLLAPIVSDNGIVGILNNNGIDLDAILAEILGADLATYIQSKDVLNAQVGLELELKNIENCNIHEVLIPILNKVLAQYGITLNNINWKQLVSRGDVVTASSDVAKAGNQFITKRVVNVDKGKVLIDVLRYISNVLINNAKPIKNLVTGIGSIKSNATLKNILSCVFDQIDLAQQDDIIHAIFFFLLEEGDNAYFDYTNFTYEEYEFSFGNMDENFCRQLGPMLDGLVGGMINLNDMVTSNVYKDSIITTIATGLYGAVEGVKISNEIGSLTHLLSLTGIDFTTTNVANLLVDEAYGQKYEDASNIIKSAGSWANVNADSLKWGVTDRDSFVHALAAVLRPIYGVLDVLLNNGSLNLFNLISVPGSDGYTSFLVPLMEAFGLYNIKTQYQYREDIFNAYDNILIDVLNPLLDKVEDILSAPIETLTDILPNLALVFANGGLLQIINNLLTPVSAILNAIRPIIDANKLLDALNVDIAGMLASVGITGDIVIDVYDLPATLTPLVGAASVTDLLNGVLSTIKVGGAPLGIVLPQINWYQLASHGEVILDGTSQVACHGMRISVKADQDETLIALLRFLINTVNYGENYDAICGLIGGLIGGADASVSDMVGQVLGMLQGDADSVIEDIVSLLQDLAG